MTKQQEKGIQILELQSALEAEKFAHQLTENSLKKKDDEIGEKDNRIESLIIELEDSEKAKKEWCKKAMEAASQRIFLQQQLKEKDDFIEKLKQDIESFYEEEVKLKNRIKELEDLVSRSIMQYERLERFDLATEAKQLLKNL